VALPAGFFAGLIFDSPQKPCNVVPVPIILWFLPLLDMQNLQPSYKFLLFKKLNLILHDEDYIKRET